MKIMVAKTKGHWMKGFKKGDINKVLVVKAK